MADRDRFRGTRSQDNIDKYLAPQSDGLKMYDMENPDIGFFNRIDSELIRLAGSPVLVYRYTGEDNYDEVLDEDPQRVYDVQPALCDSHYDPRMFEEPLAEFGIEMSQDQLFTFNRDDITHQLGRELRVGDLIFTKFQNTLFEVTEVQEDSFESYGVYHLVASAKVMRVYERLLTILGLNRFFKNVGNTGGGTEPPPKVTGLKDIDSLNILIGGMTNIEIQSDTALRELVLKEFNMFTVGNYFKWKQLLNDHKSIASGYNFATTDAFVQFANDNNLYMKGHTLMWSKPSFLPNDYPTNAAGRIAATEAHITEVVGHFKGKVNAWDVWNEPINTNGVGLKGPITEQEIGRAFVAARNADPDALLVLNDFRISGGNLKTETMQDVVRTLKEGGAPIDAVGMQMHIHLGGQKKWAPTEIQFANTLRAYENMGVKVLITEFDIRIADLPNTMTLNEKLQEQREYAEMVMRVCNNAPNCHSISFWGVADKYSWIYNHDKVTYPTEQPLPFDLDFKRKPFYNGLYTGAK